MIVTASQLKSNLGKYLELAAKNDVYITKNGKKIAKLTSPTVNKTKALDALVGIIPTDEKIDMNALKAERLSRQ